MEQNELILGATMEANNDLPLKVYLINQTDKSFIVRQVQGSFDGKDLDGPILDLGHGEAGTFELPPKSYYQVDQMDDRGELDFITWYHFHCKPDDGGQLFKIWGQIDGNSVYDRKKDIIPILNKIGLIEELYLF